MADKMYIGDVGTILIIDCQTNIADATSTLIKVRKPDETDHDWVTTIYNSNYLKYTVVADDFDQCGIYHAQAYVVTPNGTWRGESFAFEIYDTYK